MNEPGVRERMKKVKTEKSRANNLLQLADMVCGAVARSVVSEKKQARQYRSLIQFRELQVQVWPRPDAGA